MRIKLSVFNPSNYPRGGHVVTPWQPIGDATGISPDAFRLLTEDGEEIPAQVDRIDPSDRRLDTLAFVLPDDAAAPGPEDYSQPTAAVFLESVGRPKAKKSTAAADPAGPPPRRVELANGKLVVSISLLPSQDNSERDWFAGSAQSVRMGATELLDVWRSKLGLIEHDVEKRCMQVDRLFIQNPPWAGEPAQEVPLFKMPYERLSFFSGPVRTACTIVSAPFEYVYADPSHKSRTQLECNFYRTLILYNSADYLIEELWLKGRDLRAKGEPVDLLFSARYFSYMDLGFDPAIYRYEDVPDWFAIGYPHGYIHPGYGFATDVHARQLRYPHPAYPVRENSYKTFSWELYPSRKARCLHLFQLDNPDSIERRTGHAWYEEIYKPLNKVELEREK
jgi:hypothetical protein